MYINKTVQALAKNVAAKGNIRPTLAGVSFQNNKAIATDAFKLCEISFKEYENIPDISGFKETKNLNGIISKEDILELKIPKTKTKVINNAYIGNVSEKVNADGTRNVSIATTDLVKSNIVNTRELKGYFPDYESFLPDEINLEVGIGIEHLEDLIKVYKEAGVKALKFGFKDPSSPIRILPEGVNSYELNKHGIENIRSILMPIKI